MQHVSHRASDDLAQAMQALRKLVNAIDAKWSLETERRRSNAISPAIDEALDEARKLLGIEPVADIDAYRKRFRSTQES